MEGQRLALVCAVIFLASCALIGTFVQYYFGSGVLAPPGIGGTGGREKVSIQNPSGNATSATITVYAQSTGVAPVVLDSAIIKDSQGSVIAVIGATRIDDNDANTAVDVPTIDAELTRLDITATPGTLIAGEIYTVTLVTTTGNSFVSEAFTAVAYKYPW